MKKYFILCVIFVAFVLVFNSVIVYSANPITIKYDCEEIKLSTPVLVEDEVILVPLRNIFEAFGAKVVWNASDQSILVSKDNKNIVLKLNKQISKIGEKYCVMDKPINLVNSSTLIPLSFIKQVFPVEVEVNGENINIYDSSYGFTLKAKSHILIESNSGLILLNHNGHKQLSAGNITKIMNLILIFEAIEEGKISLADTVRVSKHAASMEGSQLFLKEDEQILVDDLIKSIIVMGANDSAMALAEYIAGSEKNFINQMNKKAKELGLENTHFANITGIDEDDHYTSSYDVAIMAKEVINKYNILGYSSITKDEIIRNTKTKEIKFPLINHNKLLKEYKGASGLIKGFTSKAKHCIVGTAKNDGLQLIAVTLGAADNKNIIHETVSLLDYGFEKYEIIK